MLGGAKIEVYASPKRKDKRKEKKRERGLERGFTLEPTCVERGARVRGMLCKRRKETKRKEKKRKKKEGKE